MGYINCKLETMTNHELISYISGKWSHNIQVLDHAALGDA